MPPSRGADQEASDIGNVAHHCTMTSGYLGSTIMVKRMHELVSFALRADTPIHSPEQVGDSASTRDSHTFASSTMRLAASLVTFECCSYVSHSAKPSSSSSSSSSSFSSSSRSSNLHFEDGSRRYEQTLLKHEANLLGTLLQCTPLLVTVAISSATNSVKAIVTLNAIAAAAAIREPHQYRSVLDTMYTSHGADVASIAMSCGDVSQAAALSLLLLITSPLPRKSETEGHGLLPLPFFKPSQLIAAIPDRLVDDESQATTALALHLCARMIYGDYLISSFAKQQPIDTSADGTSHCKKRNFGGLKSSTMGAKGGDGAPQKRDSWWQIGNGKTRTQVQLLAQHHALAPCTIVSEAACAALLVIRATILPEPLQASSDYAQNYEMHDWSNENQLQTHETLGKTVKSWPGSRIFSLFSGGTKAAADWSSGWHRILCEEILGSVLSESRTGPFALLLLASTVRSRPCWIRDVFGTDSICLALLRSLKKECDGGCVVEQQCYFFLFGCLLNAGLMTLAMISKLHDDLKCLHQLQKQENSLFTPMWEQQQHQHRRGAKLSWVCLGSKDLLIPRGIDWATGITDAGASSNATIFPIDLGEADGDHILHPLQLEHRAIAGDLLVDLSAKLEP